MELTLGQQNTYKMLYKSDRAAAERYKKLCLTPFRIDDKKQDEEYRICQLKGCNQKYYRNEKEARSSFKVRQYCSRVCRDKAKITFKGKAVISNK